MKYKKLLFRILNISWALVKLIMVKCLTADGEVSSGRMEKNLIFMKNLIMDVFVSSILL